MRRLLLALFFLFPFSTYSAAPVSLTYREYNTETQRLTAECVAKNLPHFKGICLSQKYEPSLQTELGFSLETHRFELFLGRCEHSDFPNWRAAQNYAFKIAKVKMFYEEMAPQTEALEIHSRFFNSCKTTAENDAEIARRLKWFTEMAAKHSVEAKEKVAQAQREIRRQNSLSEKALWELDPWFVGKFSGVFSVENDTGSWSLKCAVGEECTLTMNRPNSPSQTSPMRVPIRLDIAIPNNNLSGTREQVRQRPGLYEDKIEGEMLLPLRDLLATEAKFERCVDIAPSSDLALCSLTTDPRASKSLVLLLGTMKNSCGKSPFCAYYYQILEREKVE